VVRRWQDDSRQAAGSAAQKNKRTVARERTLANAAAKIAGAFGAGAFDGAAPRVVS